MRPRSRSEQLLLDGVLGVVTRVHLVRSEVDQVEPRRRHVDVQHDAARESALVVVERPPRLGAYGLDARPLAVGQCDESLRPLAQDRQERFQDADGAIAVDEVLRPPGLAALEQASRPRAGARRAPRGPPRRPRPGSSRVGPRRTPRPRRHRRSARPRAHARRSHSRAPGREASPRAARRARAAASATSCVRGDDVFGVDLLLELRRPVVGVDETVDVPPEAQAQLEVALGRAHLRSTSNSAACPWPTPTHIVATPRPPPRRRSSCRRLTTSRAPLIPRG